jgi:hypothetical protein
MKKIPDRIHHASRKVLLLSLLTLAPFTVAQETVTPPPAAPTPPPALAPAPIGGTQVVPGGSAVPKAPADSPLAQWGPVAVRPHLIYRLTYGDGIQSSLGQPVTTGIQEISPGILFGLGSHWTLDYTPTWTFYSNRRFTDTLDHTAGLNGGTAYGDWTFRFSQDYSRASPPLVETAQQTKQETYATGINASDRVGLRTVLDMSVSQDVRLTQRFTNTREWSTQEWLHYEVSPRLDAAIGLGYGYVGITPGPDMTYWKPDGQIAWKATDKISFNVQGGVERRKSRAIDAKVLTNPILNAAVAYQMLETTSFSFGASRAVAASYFANEVTVSTGWNAAVQQRLLGEFHLSVGVGQQKVSYVSVSNRLAAGRSDRYDSFNVGLSTTFLRRGGVSTFYRISRNSTNAAGYGFSSHQIGVELSYRF